MWLSLQTTKALALTLGGVFAILFVPHVIFAATLSLVPSSVAVQVGDTFSVDVVVSSPDQAMNAVSADISFPTNLLQVTAVNKTSYSFGLWVQKPAFSNQDGTVTFSGIIPNPGFQGESKELLSIQFSAIASGSGTLSFTSSSVLANDGNGTNILTGTSPTQIIISPAETPGAVPAPTAAVTKPAHAPSATTSSSTSTAALTVASFFKPIVLNISSPELGWDIALVEFIIIIIAFLSLLYIHYSTLKKHHRHTHRH